MEALVFQFNMKKPQHLADGEKGLRDTGHA